jgi:hypothetical protein
MFTRKHALMMTAMVATSLTLPAVAEATVADFSAGCTAVSGGLDCTFTANSGFLLIDTSAADVNITGGTVDFATSSDLSQTGGNSTGSTVNGSRNVSGLGTFTVTDKLLSGSGNPTAQSVTFFIEGSTTVSGGGLTFGGNASGNTFAAHICAISTDTTCSSTFFESGGGTRATPVPAALPLFAGGLGFVGWLAGRKRKALQVA